LRGCPQRGERRNRTAVTHSSKRFDEVKLDSGIGLDRKSIDDEGKRLGVS
jgi:hypothetical protein